MSRDFENLLFRVKMVRLKIVNCLRFANPAEATGGLEAWRLGGLEAGGSVLQVFLKGVIDGGWKVLGKGGRPHFFR